VTVRRRASLVVTLLCVGLASGCPGAGALRILHPTLLTEVTHAPLRIEVDFRAHFDLGTFRATLNGTDITDRFLFLPPENGRIVAFADLVFEPELIEGANLFEVAIHNGHLLLDRGSIFISKGDPHADSVVGHAIGMGGGFNEASLPEVVTGPPAGAGLFSGGLDVLSLGSGGWMALAFDDNVIVDGDGVDFTVFENAFLGFDGQFVIEPPFAEPGRVSVSQDGVTWHTFPCSLVPQPLPLVPPYYPGCAGVHPVLSNGGAPHPSEPTTVPIEDLVGQSALTVTVPAGAGGDSFDLADLGLAWARYVRIEGADFSQAPTGTDNFGFDLDAVTAVHTASPIDRDGNGVPDAAE